MSKRHLWALLVVAVSLTVVVQIGHARNERRAVTQTPNQARYMTQTQHAGSTANPNDPFGTLNRTRNNQWSQGYYAAGMGQNVMHSRPRYNQQRQQSQQRNQMQYRQQNRRHQQFASAQGRRTNNRQTRGMSVPKMAAMTWTPGGSAARPAPRDPRAVFCWSYIQNKTGRPQEVTHVWYQGNQKVKEVQLPVSDRSGRVFSTFPLQSNNNAPFRVEVRSPSGQVMRQMQFQVGQG